MLGAPAATNPHEHVGVEELASQVTDKGCQDRAPHDSEDSGKSLLVFVIGGWRQVLHDEECEGGQQGGHESHDDNALSPSKSVDFRQHIADDVRQREEDRAPVKNEIVSGRAEHERLGRGDIRDEKQRHEGDGDNVKGARGARRSRRDRAIGHGMKPRKAE